LGKVLLFKPSSPHDLKDTTKHGWEKWCSITFYLALCILRFLVRNTFLLLFSYVDTLSGLHTIY